MTNEILNKKIELFVDNGIDKYRRFDEIKIIDMIKIYLENNGFFIVMNKTSNFVGYLDLADMKKIKNIYDEINNYKNKTIKELIEDKEIILRTEKIDSNTPLIDVLKKLNMTDQNYFPIFKVDILIGRISKKILKEKIEQLY